MKTEAIQTQHNQYDIIVIGSGPSGQNAAVTAAKLGARVLIVERDIAVGGSCVQYGTIPSKTLRETALTLAAFRRRSGGVYEISRSDDLQIASLMSRLEQVVHAHQATTRSYLEHAGAERVHGNAQFVSANRIRIQDNFGRETLVAGQKIIIASGSRPRDPDEIPVDHENIFDSDSVLSMTYLPRSLTVFGSGVIACEYASIFATLGVRVTMIDRYRMPLGFLDPDLTEAFVSQFTASGGRFLGEQHVAAVRWDEFSSVETTLQDGTVCRSDKALVAAGRVANSQALNLSAAGLAVCDRGLIPVDEAFRTQVASIYAVGDTIGPPALASTSMEQGRRAALHALGMAASESQQVVPMGIYTIPEIASVGMSEKQAMKQGAIVGRSAITELGRGQIMAATCGLLKLVADASGTKLLGVQIVCDGATELIHLGQMAIAGNMDIDTLADSIFNFPTLAEAYRVAALDILDQRRAIAARGCPSAEPDHTLSASSPEWRPNCDMPPVS